MKSSLILSALMLTACSTSYMVLATSQESIPSNSATNIVANATEQYELVSSSTGSNQHNDTITTSKSSSLTYILGGVGAVVGAILIGLAMKYYLRQQHPTAFVAVDEPTAFLSLSSAFEPAAEPEPAV